MLDMVSVLENNLGDKKRDIGVIIGRLSKGAMFPSRSSFESSIRRLSIDGANIEFHYKHKTLGGRRKLYGFVDYLKKTKRTRGTNSSTEATHDVFYTDAPPNTSPTWEEILADAVRQIEAQSHAQTQQDAPFPIRHQLTTNTTTDTTTDTIGDFIRTH